MVAVALSGFLTNDGAVPEGTIVTAVFPGGCQLRCGFCIVRHRNERNVDVATAPSPEDYVGVLRSYADAGTLAGAAVVGDEPLQEHVWPYVEAFLEACTEAKRPSTLITNGLGLAAFHDRLRRFAMTDIVVSLDGVGRPHDRLRGMSGAFETIDHGLQTAACDPGFFQRISIATILRPEHFEDAQDVLLLVKRRGISKWLVSALLDPRPGGPVRIQTRLRSRISDMLRKLGSLAASHGVHMVATDEFGLVDEIDDVARSAGFSVRRPRSRPSLVRLDAQGRRWTWDQIAAGLVDSHRYATDNEDVNSSPMRLNG